MLRSLATALLLAAAAAPVLGADPPPGGGTPASGTASVPGAGQRLGWIALAGPGNAGAFLNLDAVGQIVRVEFKGNQATVYVRGDRGLRKVGTSASAGSLAKLRQLTKGPQWIRARSSMSPQQDNDWWVNLDAVMYFYKIQAPGGGSAAELQGEGDTSLGQVGLADELKKLDRLVQGL